MIKFNEYVSRLELTKEVTTSTERCECTSCCCCTFWLRWSIEVDCTCCKSRDRFGFFVTAREGGIVDLARSVRFHEEERRILGEDSFDESDGLVSRLFDDGLARLRASLLSQSSVSLDGEEGGNAMGGGLTPPVSNLERTHATSSMRRADRWWGGRGVDTTTVSNLSGAGLDELLNDVLGLGGGGREGDRASLLLSQSSVSDGEEGGAMGGGLTPPVSNLSGASLDELHPKAGPPSGEMSVSEKLNDVLGLGLGVGRSSSSSGERGERSSFGIDATPPPPVVVAKVKQSRKEWKEQQTAQLRARQNDAAKRLYAATRLLATDALHPNAVGKIVRALLALLPSRECISLVQNFETACAAAAVEEGISRARNSSKRSMVSDRSSGSYRTCGSSSSINGGGGGGRGDSSSSSSASIGFSWATRAAECEGIAALRNALLDACDDLGISRSAFEDGRDEAEEEGGGSWDAT